MLIGIPKEIKRVDFRVAVTPAGVKALIEGGHRVFVEKEAGEGSGLLDEEFKKAGAEIIEDKKSFLMRQSLFNLLKLKFGS